jgi:alanine racemase
MPLTQPKPISLGSPLSSLDGGTHAVVWVNLDAIVANYRTLSTLVKPAVCSAVVKADAYGMGASRVGAALYQAGCRDFFVAYLDEGIALRQALPAGGEDATIYVLNGYFEGLELEFANSALIPVLSNISQIQQWRRFGEGQSKLLPAALHVDTGMTRNGIPADELTLLREDPRLLQGIQVKLILSQMAFSEEQDNPSHETQRHRFQEARKALPAAPASLAKSAAIFLGTSYHFHLVRPGIALYGSCQSFESPPLLNPALDVWARIYQVQTVQKGQGVGYNQTYSFPSQGRAATLAVGYADGYPWSLSNAGYVTIAGYRAPIVGRISMDMITVDVTDIPEPLVHPGGWAQLIGDAMTIHDLATYAKTTPYEILLRLGKRYKRVYASTEPKRLERNDLCSVS